MKPTTKTLPSAQYADAARLKPNVTYFSISNVPGRAKAQSFAGFAGTSELVP
jgi:hypothetical protein